MSKEISEKEISEKEISKNEISKKEISKKEISEKEISKKEMEEKKMRKKETEHYKFSQNSKCEYFPCHKVSNKEEFNCLFCYCPLYALKDQCGGNFRYNEKGIKDCTNCTLPHGKNGYEHIMAHIRGIIELGRK